VAYPKPSLVLGQASPSLPAVGKLSVGELPWEGLLHTMARTAPGSSRVISRHNLTSPHFEASLQSYGCTKSLLIFRLGKCVAWCLLVFSGQNAQARTVFILTHAKQIPKVLEGA